MRASEPASEIPNDVSDHRTVGELRIYTGSAALESRKGPPINCLRPVNKCYGDLSPINAGGYRRFPYSNILAAIRISPNVFHVGGSAGGCPVLL